MTDSVDRTNRQETNPAPLPAEPVTAAKGGRSPTEADGAGSAGRGGPAATPLRWHAHHKRTVVLRLFAGEALDALSREYGVPVDRLEAWRKDALSGIDAGLAVRSTDDPVQRRLDDANRRIGELTVEVDILRARVAKQGPFRGRRLTK